jgi:periplasmic divalent cation tolerance protein
MTSHQFIVAMITVPSEEIGVKISESLLEKKLAACVNILPSINSLYTWQGKICNDKEILLIIKTRADFFESEFVDTVKALHPYDEPEIIALPILMGSETYLKWIRAVTKE